MYGGTARTMLVEHDGDPVIALPFVRIGPAAARLVTVPGVDAPFRGFPAAADAPDTAYDTLIVALGAELNALRIGPVAEGDAVFAALREAALRRGWLAVNRASAAPADDGLDHMVAGDCEILDGAALVAGGFDRLAHLDGSGEIAFWRNATADSVLAAMLSAEIAVRDGEAVAFALYLDGGEVRHVIAGARSPTQIRVTRYDWLLIKPGFPALLGRALGGRWSRPPTKALVAR